ncbi:hypothetical protein [Marinicrinis lubricantis]|uniref:Uncharacterized protein n=1 Tax=Marinicrinis lubricantis TaxID=2086470 RepID=A0ABW1ILI0_9BACL
MERMKAIFGFRHKAKKGVFRSPKYRLKYTMLWLWLLFGFVIAVWVYRLNGGAWTGGGMIVHDVALEDGPRTLKIQTETSGDETAVSFDIPYLGYFLAMSRSNAGFMVFVVLPLVIIFWCLVVRLIRLLRVKD